MTIQLTFENFYLQVKDSSEQYRVVKMHRMPYLYRSLRKRAL